METIAYKNIDFVAWDVGGRDKIRPLYRHYYVNTQALIFVVDSNDRERIGEVKEILRQTLGEDELRDSILVVLANKKDLEKAMSADEVSQAIGFEEIRGGRAKKVFSTCALTGEGLYEAFEWMANVISGCPIDEASSPIKETIEDTKALAKQVQSSSFGSLAQLFKYLTKSSS